MCAVTAGGGLGQNSVDVGDSDRQPIYLEFKSDVGGIDFEVIEGALVPGFERLLAGYIAQAEHGNRVSNRFKLLRWRRADAEGGGVRSFEVGILVFEIFEFAEEFVVFVIGQRRLTEHVVLVVSAVECRAQLCGASFGDGSGILVGAQLAGLGC